MGQGCRAGNFLKPTCGRVGANKNKNSFILLCYASLKGSISYSFIFRGGSPAPLTPITGTFHLFSGRVHHYKAGYDGSLWIFFLLFFCMGLLWFFFVLPLFHEPGDNILGIPGNSRKNHFQDPPDLRHSSQYILFFSIAAAQLSERQGQALIR